MGKAHLVQIILLIGVRVVDRGDTAYDLSVTVSQETFCVTILEGGVLLPVEIVDLAAEHIRHIIRAALIQIIGKINELFDVPAF
jgi:hypothetical protein